MKKRLSVLNGVLKDNHIFMIDLDTWFLVDYETESGSYNVVTDLQREDIQHMCWFVKILVYVDSLVCVQRNSKEIVIFTPGIGTARYGSEYEFGEDIDIKYVDAHIYGNLLFMMPGNTNGNISVFDLKKRTYLNDFCLKDGIDSTEKTIGGTGIYKWLFDEKNERAKTFVPGTDIILNIDFDGFHISIEHSGYECSFFGGSYQCPMVAIEPGGQNYVIDYDGEWKKRNVTSSYEMNNEYKSAIKYLIHYGEYELIIPTRNDRIDVFDQNGILKKTINFPDESKGDFRVRGSNIPTTSFVINEGKIFILPFSGSGITICDIKTGEVDFQPIEIDGSLLIKKDYHRYGPLTENVGHSLEDYVGFVKGEVQ